MCGGRWAAAILALSVPAVASAAACCLSASVGATPRLVVWEEAAAGVSLTYGHGVGRFGAGGAYRPRSAGLVEDEVRLDGWAMLRLGEQWQLFAQLPWVVGLRASPSGAGAVGTGPGDVSAALRWDAVGIGEYLGLPGVAVVAMVSAPSGRSPELAMDPLGASATGRGVWAAGLGVTAEYSVLPWAVRLDLGALYHAASIRPDTGLKQQFGPSFQAGVMGARELLADRLVLALSLRAEHELPRVQEGQVLAGTGSTGVSASLSASWKMSSHWTVTGAVSSDAPGRLGLAAHRADRLTVTSGVRYGFF